MSGTAETLASRLAWLATRLASWVIYRCVPFTVLRLKEAPKCWWMTRLSNFASQLLAGEELDARLQVRGAVQLARSRRLSHCTRRLIN